MVEPLQGVPIADSVLDIDVFLSDFDCPLSVPDLLMPPPQPVFTVPEHQKEARAAEVVQKEQARQISKTNAKDFC